jgi:hypothetical protein
VKLSFDLVIEKNQFKGASTRLHELFADLVRDTAFDLRDATQVNIIQHGLVDMGLLVSSVSATQIGPFKWRVVVGAEYGIYHEFGTGIFTEFPGAEKKEIVIEPVSGKALFWQGARHPVKKVVIEGVPPRPFFGPAVDEIRPAFFASVQMVIEGSVS